MARTEVRSSQIKDQGVTRDDLNTTTAGKAVVTKVIAGSGVSISSTGVDTGTGDVTVNSSPNQTTEQTLKTHSNFTGSERKENTAALQTTDGNTATLFSVTVPDGSVLRFKFDVVARKQHATENKSYWNFLFGAVRRNNGSIVFVGTVVSMEDDEGTPGYIATVDVSGNDLRIRVTGAAAENVNWAANTITQAILLNT